MLRRTFGCEFEFSSIIPEIYPTLKQVLPTDSIRVINSVTESINNKKWHLKRDYSTGSELATPVSSMKDIKNICSIIKYLSKNENIRISEDDGFHVHVFAGDMDVDKVTAAWIKMEKTILSLVPKYRRDNCYCVKIKGKGSVPKEIIKAQGRTMDHHSSFSTSSMDTKRKTVEFRLAEGTLDPIFVLHWVRLCIGIVDWAKSQPPYKLLLGKPENLNLVDISKNLKLPQKTKEFLKYRQDKFGSKKSFPVKH